MFLFTANILFVFAALRYIWHITLCKLKVYNVMIWYIHISQNNYHLNTSIRSHNYQFFMWWGQLRFTLLVTFKYICHINNNHHAVSVDPQNLFILYLEICTLWTPSPHFSHPPHSLVTIIIVSVSTVIEKNKSNSMLDLFLLL